MELIDVIAVKTLPDYKLFLKFETGEDKVFDFKPKLDMPVFRKIAFQTRRIRDTISTGACFEKSLS